MVAKSLLSSVGVKVLLVTGFLLCGVGAGDPCNRYPPLIGFQVDKYMGRWWQIEKTPTMAELPGKCWSSYYYKDPQNVNKLHMRMDYVARIYDVVMNFSCQTDKRLVSRALAFGTNSPNTFHASLTMPNPGVDPSYFTYAAPALPWMQRKYRVLATDYENFSIEYMCQTSFMGVPEETVWVLTRSRTPTLEVMQQARHTLQVLGLDKIRLYDADQSCKERSLRRKSMIEWLLFI